MPTKLTIVKNPHKVLREKAKDIPHHAIASSRIQTLIADMKETLTHTPDGVGLAAPQVGESIRLFIVSDEAEEIDRAEEKQKKHVDTSVFGAAASGQEIEKPYPARKWDYYVFINPVIKKRARRKIKGMEGCLSVPQKFGLVARAERITVEAYDEKGKKFTRGASRFLARVIQHELDHLEGKLFIDAVKKHNP